MGEQPLCWFCHVAAQMFSPLMVNTGLMLPHSAAHIKFPHIKFVFCSLPSETDKEVF